MKNPSAGSFIVTKEHRRFVEFADAVRKHRYIGVCYGRAGVGKTLSAQRYARWHQAIDLLTTWGVRDPSDLKVYAALDRSRAVFYTPTVGSNLRDMKRELQLLMERVDICIAQHHRTGGGGVERGPKYGKKYIQLLIIDEAERLPTTTLEFLRDIFDRQGIGLILIGMPGIEKSLSRYPQLYSRVGFAHQYRALQNDELKFVLTRRWAKLGVGIDDADFTDAQAIAAIVRITGGNFRLLQRLLIQIERILQINDLRTISDDVVEAARSTLVIGGAI